MSDQNVDPSGNTEAFRAFSRDTPEPAAPASKTPLVIGGVVAVVLILAIAWWALA